MALLGERLETELDGHGLNFYDLLYYTVCISMSVSKIPTRNRIRTLDFCKHRPKLVRACQSNSVSRCLFIIVFGSFGICFFGWCFTTKVPFAIYPTLTVKRTKICPWRPVEQRKACWYEEKEDGNRTISGTYTFCQSSFCQKKWWYLWKCSICQIS